jgi:hypothetical protein
MSMDGLVFQVEWLFEDPLPDERGVTDSLLGR